ncbi:MAG TPA: hypothetical protein VN150_08260, partial [Ochrobactrum sp.]|nr:hypothetical protein [Ochrobactrum sp.]
GEDEDGQEFFHVQSALNFVLRLSHISAPIRIYIDLRQESAYMQALTRRCKRCRNDKLSLAEYKDFRKF